MIDVAAGVARINKHIEEQGFSRSGNEPDYQYGDDPSLRFKTGTVYGEVTVTVWNGQRQVTAIRSTSDEQIIEAMYEIDKIMADHFFEKVNGRC